MLQLTFVGTGVSCAIPVIGHIHRDCACDDALRRPHGPNRRNNVSLLITLHANDNDTKKDVCSSTASHDEHDAPAPPPLLRILIDCGKTFRDAYLRVLAPRKVRYVDALLLTHGHADAMLCCDQLCELHDALLLSSSLHADSGDGAHDDCHAQHLATTADAATTTTTTLRRAALYTPTYLSAATLREVQHILPELARRSRYASSSTHKHSSSDSDNNNKHDEQNDEAMSGVAHDTPRSALEWHVLPDDVPTRFYVDAVHVATSSTTTMTAVTQATTNNDSSNSNAFAMYAVPVEHGKDYMCLGFVFGRGVARRSEGGSSGDAAASGSCVVYLSDVSALPPAADAFLRDLVKIDVLIVDMLAEHGAHSVIHYCMDDLMPLLRRLTPARTYCVGMFCSVEHDDGNATWQADLAAERQRLRDVLARHQKSSSNSNNSNDNDDDEEVRAARRFLHTVQSVELAYDGMDLHLPW